MLFKLFILLDSSVPFLCRMIECISERNYRKLVWRMVFTLSRSASLKARRNELYSVWVILYRYLASTFLALNIKLCGVASDLTTVWIRSLIFSETRLNWDTMETFGILIHSIYQNELLKRDLKVSIVDFHFLQTFSENEVCFCEKYVADQWCDISFHLKLP